MKNTRKRTPLIQMATLALSGALQSIPGHTHGPDCNHGHKRPEPKRPEPKLPFTDEEIKQLNSLSGKAKKQLVKLLKHKYEEGALVAPLWTPSAGFETTDYSEVEKRVLVTMSEQEVENLLTKKEK